MLSTILCKSERPKVKYLLRYMSKDEFTKYCNGDELVNTEDHSKENFTTSKGFCFLPYKEFGRKDDFEEDLLYEFYSNLEFLDGLISEDVVCLFSIKDKSVKLNWGEGRYALPGGAFFDAFWQQEVSLRNYSKEILKLEYYSLLEENRHIDDFSDSYFETYYKKLLRGESV